jgi:hypothetical protein
MKLPEAIEIAALDAVEIPSSHGPGRLRKRGAQRSIVVSRCERRAQTWDQAPGNKLKTSELFVCLLRRGYRIDAAFLSKMRWVRPVPPGPSPARQPSNGCANGGGATDALALPPLCLGDRCSAMGHEHSIKYVPGPPPCPCCSQIMQLARTTSRSGDLPDIFAFECRACRVSYIEDGITPLCAPSFSRILTISPLGWFQADSQ